MTRSRASEFRQSLIESFHPSGTTNRPPYRVAVASIAAAYFLGFLASQEDLIPLWLVRAASILLVIILLLLTVRRLRDADLSPWLIAFVLIPDIATVDFGRTGSRLGMASFEVAHLLHCIPIVICLFARSKRVS